MYSHIWETICDCTQKQLPKLDLITSPPAASFTAGLIRKHNLLTLRLFFCSYSYLPAGLKAYTAEDIDLTRLSPKEPGPTERGLDEKKKTVKLGKVSFDDYHAMWSGIATTKPVMDSSNSLSEVLRADSKLQAAHFGLPQVELQDEIHKQLTEHNAIMYGKFDTRMAGQDLAELKATKIQLLKQIYLPKQQGKQE